MGYQYAVPDFQKIVTHFFGDRPPITVSAKMGLDDSIQIRLSVPDYNGPFPENVPGAIQWGGVNAWFDITMPSSKSG